MLGRWLRRMVVAVFGRAAQSPEQVNPTLMASRKARAESAKVHDQVRPHIDRGRALIEAYQAKDGALRGHR